MKFCRRFASSMAARARPAARAHLAANPIGCIRPSGASRRNQAAAVEGHTATAARSRWSMRVGFLPFLQVDFGVVVSLLPFRVPLPRLVSLTERAFVGFLARIVRRGFLA